MDSHCKYMCLLCPDFQLNSFRCALIHCHRPDLLDYDKLDKVRPLFSPHFPGVTSTQSDRHGNTRLAFQVAADHLGIPVSVVLSGFGAVLKTFLPATARGRRSV